MSVRICAMGAVMLCLVAGGAAAREVGQAGDIGAGVVLGSPTGLSLKYWTAHERAVDAGLAWKFGHEDQLAITADHLWHHTLPTGSATIRGWLPFYVGVGLRVLAGHDAEAGVRVPLGVSYLLPDAPLEFFAEIVPVVEFAPDTDGALDGGVGIRYYFNVN